MLESLTLSHIRFGVCARSIVFMYRYKTPILMSVSDEKGLNDGPLPSFSLTVAYLEFARGHDCLLQKPVTLYSFLQKFWVDVLEFL